MVSQSFSFLLYFRRKRTYQVKSKSFAKLSSRTSAGEAAKPISKSGQQINSYLVKREAYPVLQYEILIFQFYV
jgi:hypothetical protein